LDPEHSIAIRYRETGETVQSFHFYSGRYQGFLASVPKNVTDYEVIVDSIFIARQQVEGAWTTTFTVHNGDEYILLAEVVPVPTATPVASLAPGQTPRATLSRSPTASPLAVRVEGNVPIAELQTDQGRHGVELAGNGSIVGGGTVETLFIAEASRIQADSIVIATYLELFDNSELSATTNGTITLSDNVSLHFSSQASVVSLPKLDLGVIGPNYNTLPAELVVDIGETKIDDTVLETLKLPLVRGRTLANCDKWVVNFEGQDASKLGTRCEDGDIVAEGRLLADEGLPLRTLYVVKKPEPGRPTDKPKSNVGLIVGVVIAAVVVVVGVVVAVVIVLKKKGGGGPSSSESISGVDA
jgi:hypothetical protein